MIHETPIAVLGAGSWGTALALHFSRNGIVVRLWGHRKEMMSEMRATRINEHYFPDTVLPDCLELFDDLTDCLHDVRDILIVVPSAGFRECLQRIKMSSNVSITELELIDEVDIQDNNVKVDLHLTSPFCPAVFGFKICQDIHDNLLKIDGIELSLIHI